MPRPAPLAGLKVLDLSRLLPGPYATLVLADLGADVVKVEDPGLGDYARHMPPLVEGTSALFLALNRGKRSLALDLKAPADRETFLLLAEKADVVVESFRPGVMARLGVGYETLAARNRGLVFCSLSGFGQEGPYAGRAGHDLGYLALSGVLGLIDGHGAPGQPNVQLADIAGGALVAVGGILAALWGRAGTGEGRWVDTSLTEGVMSVGAMFLGPFLAGHAEPPRAGRGVLSGERPCYALYPTADGRLLAVAALEPKFWSAFCGALGRADLEPFGLADGEEGARVQAEVRAILARRTLAEWTARFSAIDCCVEAVLEAEEVAAHPVHEARGTFFSGPHGRAQRTPIRFRDDEPPPAASPAPRLGADLAEVLAQWLA